MDQVYDKLTTEIPFDAVANNINSIIMEYKNGKDEYLVGGQTDTDEKNDNIDRFYNRFRKELITSDVGSKEIKSNGTEIGNFLFNNSNDMVEKATESFNEFGGSNDNIIKTLKFIMQKQIIPSCGIYIKLNKDVRNLVKKGFAKKITFDTPDSKQFNKDTYLKNILEQTVGDIIIDTPITSLSDFLRDSINTFVKNSDNQNNSYYSRYAKRYKELSDLVSKISINTNSVLDSLKRLKDKSLYEVTYDDKSNIDAVIDKLSNTVSEIEKSYDHIKSDEITKDDDFYPWIIQKYKINVMSFVTSPTNQLNNEYFEGITKQNLDEAIAARELKNAFSNNSNDRIIFATIRSSKNIDNIIKETQNYYGSLNSDMLMNKSKKRLLDIVGDITLGEYIDQINKYIDITDSFKSNADLTIGSLIDSTIRVASILGTLSSYVSNVLDKMKLTSSGSEANITRMLSSIAGWTCVDLSTVLSAMHYINANDLVMKLFLYESTSKFVNFINKCITSSTNGDKENDK